MGSRFRRRSRIESKGKTRMTYNIANIIKENKSVSDYRINTTSTQSYELFFVHKNLETVRSTSTTDTSVTIYVEHDGNLGSANFSLYASTTEDELRCKVADAVEKALLIDNKYYTLPQNETSSQTIESNFADYEPCELAAKISNAVFSASTDPNSAVNALEIFINKIKISVENSRGINKTEIKYNAMVEAIPTYNGEESVELYKFFKFSEFDEKNITDEIIRSMNDVHARSIAVKPQTPIKCNLVLNELELKELFMYLKDELNYASVYASQNAFSKGDMIQKNPTGDLISLTMCGQIKGSPDSATFDADGVTLQDTRIIQNGEVTGYYGSNRFAQYLGEKVTGDLPCIEVKTGTLSDNELTKAPYIECVSMSGLQVDVYNDYIGGEVRLGYYFDGEKTVPVTGISVAGKLSDILSGAKLSKTKTVSGKYCGPQKALFCGINVI